MSHEEHAEAFGRSHDAGRIDALALPSRDAAKWCRPVYRICGDAVVCMCELVAAYESTSGGMQKGRLFGCKRFRESCNLLS